MGQTSTEEPRPRGSALTSQVKQSLELCYRWICIGVIILSGLSAVALPVGVYSAWAEGRFEPRLLVELHRGLAFFCHLIAVGAAVRALRRRQCWPGFGQATLLAGGAFVLAMAITGIGVAMWW